MIICISGLPGSGKSTVAKKVAKLLGYKVISTGDLRGKLAVQHKMTIDELNAVNASWTHKIIDDEVKRIGKAEDNIVFDSWLAWRFVPKSIKIFLKVDPDVAARRVFENQRPDEKHQDSVVGMKKMLKNRVIEWAKQVKLFYRVDFLDESNYDLVLDTSLMNVEECANRIVEFVKSRS